MVKIILPNDENKIKEQIIMLEYLIAHDINNKDLKIHKQALIDLKLKLKNKKIKKYVRSAQLEHRTYFFYFFISVVLFLKFFK